MSIRFTLPQHLFKRLSRLHLAVDTGPTSLALGNISLSINGQQIRFAATTGRLLAVLACRDEELPADTRRDCVIDSSQFTEAAKAFARLPQAPVTFTLDATEMRLDSRHHAALVKVRADQTYPRYTVAIEQHQGRRLVPAISTMDPQLQTTAAKIAGRDHLMFNSSLVDDSQADRIWSTPQPDPLGIPEMDLRRLATSPGLWTDHELFILVMPVSRATEGRKADLSSFLPLSPVMAAAA